MLTFFKSIFGSKPMTVQEAKAALTRFPSISEKLPWMEYDAIHQCFLLEDGKSVAAIFELSDVPSEARPFSYLLQLQQNLQRLFQDTFPLYMDHESPWILQFYIQDELSLKKTYENYERYINPKQRETIFTTNYLQTVKAHLDGMANPNGLFIDNKVSGLLFRGKQRKIRMVIYRRYTSKMNLRRGATCIQDLAFMTQALLSKFEGIGIKAKKYTGKDFYEWMVRWFNPSPKQGGGSVDNLLEQCPYPGDDKMPWGYNFTEQLFYSVPRSDQETGCWYFDEKPHRHMTILGLSALPSVGHMTLARSFGQFQYALFDKFPENSIFHMTIVLQHQEIVKRHLDRLQAASLKSNSIAAELAREDGEKAKRTIENGNYFFPTVMGVYLSGENETDLNNKTTDLETLLSTNSLHVLHGDMELTPVDAYLRYLPMSYSFEFDKNRSLRSRYLSTQQLSKLLPLYGRERGTPHSNILFFNRGGEPFMFDPFHVEDKDFNSHLLVLGTTGSGKSATCTSLLLQVMACYRPRLVIIDVGNSFKLLGDYFKSLGLTTNRVEIAFHDKNSLNPFANSCRMLAQLRSKTAHPLADIIKQTEEELEAEWNELYQDFHEKDHQPDDNRDYLGEMLLSAQLMITGGEPKEEKAITREDRYLILKALVMAARSAEKEGRDQMIANDLVKAFATMTADIEKDEKNKRYDTVKRINKMSANLNLFCQDTLSSQYFNSPGNPWPDVDVTILEMGLFKDEGYDAQRALAYLGALNKTMSLAEKSQYEERFTIFYCDEVHLFTKYPPTMLATTKCSKMSRKYALWLWLATQNVADFPDEARKMLSMMEFWLCLGTSDAELIEIERFKTLSEEERLLFRSVRKEAGKYVEGVLLCNRFKGLFRNIPPRISLALAMTEKNEKAERRRIMQTHQCTEVEAAMIIADEMMKKR